MTDKERDHQIDVLLLILGATVAALQLIGYFKIKEASKIMCIANRADDDNDQPDAAEN